MAVGSPLRRVLRGFVLVVLLAIPALLLTANLKDPTRLNAVDRVVLRVSSPIQRAVSWVVEGIGGVWNKYVWLVDVEDENRELRRVNDELRVALAEARRQGRDAAAAHELAGLPVRRTAETVGAHVIAVGTNASFRVQRIVLDRGEGTVAVGMPVLSPDGVVGRITRVYGRYADVLLATDPQSAIEVIVKKPGAVIGAAAATPGAAATPATSSGGARGILKGLGGSSYLAKVEYVEANQEIAVGDEVVTSGLGGTFPRDVPVGRVKAIRKTEYGLYQEVDVDPAVDFSRLSAVLVILAPPPPLDPGARSKKVPEPAFGVTPFK